MKIIILAVFQLILVKAFTQTEVSIYGGILDLPGLAVEHKFNNKISFSLGGSFYSKKSYGIITEDPIYHRKHNSFANLELKKYKTNAKEVDAFYYGIYARYWLLHNFVKNVDEFTPAQIEYAENNNLTISLKEHKISIGLLTGYKLYPTDKLCINLTGGFGFSPKQWYIREINDYGLPLQVVLKGSNDFIGYFNHISAIGRVSLCYKF
ncbi:MAG TPA: hypothetical protein PKN32_03170 [Bacteroidales bacterium]|nr:hypothetical protein [Bacteroidales bacterium]